MTGDLASGQIKLAAYIDHTYLKPDATHRTIEQLCKEAVKYGFYSVCVNSAWVPYCRQQLLGTSVRIAAVCGFPLGAALKEVKAFEAARAVEAGASEIDMVLNVGLLKEGLFELVYEDILAVVQAVQAVSASNRNQDPLLQSEKPLVKVIIETSYLNEEQKRMACKLAERAGADFVKTSTGFSDGGATVDDIRLMREVVSPHIGVKASGGIRDRETAVRMIESGATRLGTSSGIAIESAPSTELGHAQDNSTENNASKSSDANGSDAKDSSAGY